MTTPRNAPDLVGLAIAREVQQKVRPAEIILGGSRPSASTAPTPTWDLTAIAPDDGSAERTNEILRELLEGKTGTPVVNAHAVTQAEFQHWAIQAQSFAGQAARYGVTPEGRSLGYRPERDPTPEEIREPDSLLAQGSRTTTGQLRGSSWKKMNCATSSAWAEPSSGDWSEASRGCWHPTTIPSSSAATRRSCGGTLRASGPSRTARAPRPWRTCWPPPPGRTGPDAASPPSPMPTERAPSTPA